MAAGTWAARWALVKVALRNVVAHRVNFFVGVPLLVSSALLVVLSAVSNTIYQSTEQGLKGSFIGDLQVFNQTADSPAMYTLEGPPIDVDPIPEPERAMAMIAKEPGVAGVVQFGLGQASVYTGNVLDRMLAKLRSEVRSEKEGHGRDPNYDATLAWVRYAVHTLHDELEGRTGYFAPESYARDLDALKKADTEGFWAAFPQDPYAALEFLENHTAPVVSGLNPDQQIAYLGGSLDEIRQAFPRVVKVRGDWSPASGQTLMLPDDAYDALFKLPAARRLDKLHKAITEKGETIADEPDLQEWLKENRNATRELTLALGPVNSKEAVTALQGLLASKETDLGKLFDQFFQADDSNFETRYRFFYDRLAPLMDLYAVHFGDRITLRSLTKGGSIATSTATFYGTYRVDGVDVNTMTDIPMGLTDRTTFDRLLGHATADEIAEMSGLAKSIGAELISQDEAEKELTGQNEGESVAIGELDPAALIKKERAQAEPASAASTKPPQMQSTILSVRLAPGANPATVIAALQSRAKAEHLPLQFVPWKKASGYLGGFVTGARVLVVVGALIILLLLTLVIHNTLTSAVLQREAELGTLRAIGAQRGFLLRMILAESSVLVVAFGGLGTLLGCWMVGHLHASGISAHGIESLVFFFGGPTLKPVLQATDVLRPCALLAALVLISTYLPARLAMSISPLRAMQARE